MTPRHISQLPLWFAFSIVGFFSVSCVSPWQYPTAPAAVICVSPSGDDQAAGTPQAPFRTLFRAQEVARAAAESATGDVVVNLAAGDYVLDKTFELTDADSGRGNNCVIYRSADGPGKARLLGSMPATEWEPFRDGIWRAKLPEDVVCHTLYENGIRAHKARFPNVEHQPDFPTARGRYLLTEDGTPKRHNREGEPIQKGPGWLTFPAEDIPPVPSGDKAKLLIFTGGKCDWMRSIYKIRSVDPETRRLVFEARSLPFGVGIGARFFLEDDLSFLDAPGEFYVDEAAHTLYYKPMEVGSPGTLGIRVPLLDRLVQVQGSSREEPASNIRFEGLALEETDGSPIGWWSTRYGLRDGALIWMNNAQGIEIDRCHLKNGGRNGIAVVGHCVGNRITRCWIEGMGVNGITLSNRWHDRKQVLPLLDRCEKNLVYDCRIHRVGEVHTYAACINVFNVSDNEISHCELYDSVRYAVTLRGNTGAQYGPPVTNDWQPACKGNWIHHVRAFRCGQDGGDMGTLHCANLNNPGDGSVNTFEQITVADSCAIPSMADISPDGIFLDWPKMSMDQIFRNVHIIRSQGKQIRSNGPQNADSAQTFNVSWEDGFRPDLMDYDHIGLTAGFPREFGTREGVPVPPPAVTGLTAKAIDYHTVVLRWHVPDHSFVDTPFYTIYRDGKAIATVSDLAFADTRGAECQTYRYHVVVRDGEFCHPGEKSRSRYVRTPPDLTRPRVENAWVTQDGQHIRLLFSKTMSRRRLLDCHAYCVTPPVAVRSASIVGPRCVELSLVTPLADAEHTLSVTGLTDGCRSRNPVEHGEAIPIIPGGKGAHFPMLLTRSGALLDTLGSAGDATLYGTARLEQGVGPFGGPALVLDGKTAYAEASADFNLGPGDFTLMLWMKKEGSGHTVLSKGNGFESMEQWSFGWPGKGVRNSVSLRLNNVFHSTAEGSIPPKTWTHVAFVRQGKVGYSYVNGALSGIPHDLSEAGSLVNDEPLRIGRRSHEPDPAYFKGEVADVILLPYALSQQEIRQALRP